MFVDVLPRMFVDVLPSNNLHTNKKKALEIDISSVGEHKVCAHVPGDACVHGWLFG